MMKNRFLSWILKTAGCLVGLFIIVTIIVSLVVNHTPVQDKILELVTEHFAEKLETSVKIDHVKVKLFEQSISIYGIEIEDQQHRKMLQVKELWASMKMLPLLTGKIVLKEGKLSGADAYLLKPQGDEPANYQFVLDAFKKKKKDKDVANDEHLRKKKQIFHFDLKYATLDDIHVRYNDYDVRLKAGSYKNWNDEHLIVINHAKTLLVSDTKKGKVDHFIDSGTLTAQITKDGHKSLKITDLVYRTDNHLPRKNTGKPHRGAFDKGHLDITANVDIDVKHLSKDSIYATIKECSVRDTVTGFNFTDIRFILSANKKQAQLTDLMIRQDSTRISIPKANVILPNKKEDTELSYSADQVTARVFLRDIAQPFAPVLRNFKLPLNLSVKLSGTDNTMTYRSIRVHTDDNKFHVASTGVLRDMKEKEKMTLHFDVHDMIAKSGIKDKIIHQFPIKKFLMRQVYALGAIRYHGSFDILWKKEEFRGILNTEMGDVDFNFALDEKTKYLSGQIETDSMKLGGLFDLKKFKDIACTAHFTFDYSKKRTAEIRKKRGGKLPIGSVKADIKRVGYKSIHIKNMLANIKSDGALAEGDVILQGKLTDLVVKFSFTNTEQMHKMKIKPGLKFRKITKEEP